MNAILKYPGGKWRIAEWIISHFPPHKVYCEPFFGSGAVFFTKSACNIETINDVDGNVVNLFRVCRDNPAELARALEFTPWSREEYVNCAELKINDPIERARRTVVRFHQSFGTDNHSKKSWRNVQKYN
ncbi:MAG: DNA adenine methylase, partial [Clostridia bacterium]|nr:DNA adenine methylase [Clostridia bacterium]